MSASSAGAPVLVLRHEPFEHLGHFASVLEKNRIPYRNHDLGEPLPLGKFQGLVIMGGPMSANDPFPGLRDELALIETALCNSIPILGICLGSQLIAKALGARVYQNRGQEIGWEAVTLTEASRSDPLFEKIPSPAMFFHWHSETFDLPDGAELLASSPMTPHQAFRYGHSVYGIQFHPEITAEMIEDWCHQPVNCGDVAQFTAPIDPHFADTTQHARGLFQSWLDLF